MNEVEKLAEIVGKYHMGCNLPVECNTECAKCCAKAILDAGYLPVQPVQLEELTDEEIIKELCKVLAIRYGYADSETIDWIMKNIIAVIARNDAKGQLYRRIRQ